MPLNNPSTAQLPRKKSQLMNMFGALAVVIGTGSVLTLPFVAKQAGIVTQGNAVQYSVAQTEALPNSPLNGKTIIFLGSSITAGTAAYGESFVDFMAKKDGIIPVKAAVAGTTLVTQDSNSYIPRMKAVDPSLQADAFICQLSTNDAAQTLPLGSLAATKDPATFNTHTIAGAIETIIAYASTTWKAPVIFLTGTRYSSLHYGRMVDLLLQIQQKWGIGVIDLWNNTAMNAISGSQRALYMIDDVHPSRAGYREWWTPVMEQYLYTYLTK